MSSRNIADYLQSTFFALAIVILWTFVVEFLGVWQFVVVGAFIGGLLVHRSLRSFLVGAVGVGLTWLLFILYYAWVYRALTLAGMFVQVLGLPETFSLVLVLMTLIIGGLLGGVSALAGSFAHALVRGRTKK